MKRKEDNVWFFIKDHQQQGPVCLFELQKLIEQRVLSGETYVWNKYMPCWQMAKTLDVFTDSIVEATRFHLLSENKSTDQYEEDTYPKGRPYVRYLARFFDLSLFSLLLITIISIFSPNFISETSNGLIFIGSLILWILIEPLMIAIFGNTLGKAFLHTKIKTVNGVKLNYMTALKRSLLVSIAGMGFGIPILNLICFLFSFRDLTGRGMSAWDQKIGTVILYGQVSPARILFASLIPAGMLAAGFII